MRKKHEDKRPSRGRHETQCGVCKHTRRAEIETEWINWAPTSRLARRYGVSRDALYRHAHALGLFAKRQRNVRAALERIIEGAGEVEVNAAAVVSAVRAYASINSLGQWVERSEQINLNQLFDRMTREELEAYASDGTLPAWFTRTVGATASHGQESKEDA